MPRLDLEMNLLNSQVTTKTTSQMSPLESAASSYGSGPGAFPLLLELSQSASPDHRTFHLPVLEGLSSAHKSHIMPGDEKLIVLGVDEDYEGIEEWGMEIDEFGNISTRDEPELPPMFGAETQATTQPLIQHSIEEAAPIFDDYAIMNEEALPDAPALPGVSLGEAKSIETESVLEGEKLPAKRRKKKLEADSETQFPTPTIGRWQFDYIQNCGSKVIKAATAKQARDNAIHLTFGLGFGNIGLNLGVPGVIHPLAVTFSGDSLYTTITGFEVDTALGKRRSTREPSDSTDENGRRVRARTGEVDEHDFDKYNTDAGQHVFDDDDEVDRLERQQLEVGREIQPAMSDAPSSAMRMPWARGSSAVPGSSVKGHGSAQASRHKLISPSQGRGHLPDIERYSDHVGGDWADGGGGLHSFNGSFDGVIDGDQVATQPGQSASGARSQDDGQKFLEYISAVIEVNGERQVKDKHGEHQGSQNCKWLRFDDAFVPDDITRAVAVSAFYNVLCLATKSQIKIRAPEPQPFSDIWLGVESAVTSSTQ